MGRIATLLLCGLGLLAVSSPHAAPGSNAVAVEPNPVSPGHTITMRWYFTGTKVVVSGGRFGKGTIVTGKTALTDRPSKTTRYTFDVWYRAETVSPKTGKKENLPLHQQYTVVAEVQRTTVPSLTSYRDPHGWQINYLSGWKRDNVTTADEGSDGQVFFQKADDSVERLAVAIMPVKDMTCDALMQRVQSEVPNNYDSPVFLVQTNLEHETVPAQWVTFTGMDHTHPGTKTTSVVMAFVRDGRAYVISARTDAAHFKARQDLLEKMVKSFRFTGDSHSSNNKSAADKPAANKPAADKPTGVKPSSQDSRLDTRA